MKEVMEGWKQFLNEMSGLSRVYGHIMEHDSAILSAFRNEYTNKENYDRSRYLKAGLLSEGYNYKAILVPSENIKRLKGRSSAFTLKNFLSVAHSLLQIILSY